MRSEEFSFYFRGLGVETCSLDAASASATVCKRLSRAFAKGSLWPCLWRVLQEWAALWVSNVSSHVSVVALYDVPTCFIRCRKSFCVAGTILLHRLQIRQAQHFGELHCHFASQAQHFRRVVLRVCGESHCQGCAKWWQCATSLAGVAFFWDVMKFHGSIARNITDFNFDANLDFSL